MTTFTSNFCEIGAKDVPIVGGKGANLGEMTRAGLPVPPGFCVVADAYREFIRSSSAMDTIRHLLSQLVVDDPEDLETRTEQIRNFLVAQPMPVQISQDIIESYGRLQTTMGAGKDGPAPIAVRSSATAEDLPTASFAGQQDTYLNIRGEDAFLEHVRRCWASLWTARAVAYRVKQGFDHEDVALAVVVQAMIQSEVSGILFTANPVNSNRDELVLNASWGLGEAIVSGMVNPDTLTIRKSDGAITSRNIATKERAVVYDSIGGTVEVDLPDDKRAAPALTDQQVDSLASIGMQIEKHYGTPMDIEWGYANDKFYVLQARAITTIAPKAADTTSALLTTAPGEFNRTMFIEIFPEPISPILMSVVKPLFTSMLDFTFQTLGFNPPTGMEGVAEFYNQPYFHREYIAGAFQPLSPQAREALVTQVVNPFGRHNNKLHVELSPAYLGMMVRLLRFMTGFPAQLPGIISRYRSEIANIESEDVDKASDQEIFKSIESLVLDSARRLLNYDFLMIALIGLSYQMLGTLLERYFGDESEQIRAKLISGVTGNVTMETNKHLWDLAQIAKASPKVSAVLRTNSGDVRAILAEQPEGNEFLTELDHFLKDYGHREIRMDILYPTWGEDPTPVFSFVRGYLDVGENASPHRQQRRLVQEREELALNVERRVQRDLAGRLVVWPILDWVLKHTQTHTRERDTMHFELTRMFPPFRRMLLELGRRWTAKGLLVKPDDIFFLTLDEIGQVAELPRPVLDLVKERRAQFEASRVHGAPPLIRDGKEVVPESAPSTEHVEGQWRGIAGSPGRVTGIARIIRGPDEFDRLQTGDILVAPLTNPVWTPLFAIAGGLVTEVGGILSHGAIVAREYGIPAVMAVAGATKSLQEGQRLTVDGNKGIVSIE